MRNDIFNFRKSIQMALDSGTWVVVDRYAYSGVAFSAAKGLDLNWCKAPDAGLPKPDLVFFLDVAPELASSRKDYGSERYEKVEFQKKVYSVFQTLFEDNFRRIDATGKIENIQKTIQQEVEGILNEPSNEDCLFKNLLQ